MHVITTLWPLISPKIVCILIKPIEVHGLLVTAIQHKSCRNQFALGYSAKPAHTVVRRLELWSDSHGLISGRVCIALCEFQADQIPVENQYRVVGLWRDFSSTMLRVQRTMRCQPSCMCDEYTRLSCNFRTQEGVLCYIQAAWLGL